MLFRSITDRQTGRRNDRWPKHPLSSLLDGFQCARHDEHMSHGSLGVAVPPFGCAFSTAPGLQNVLAVANEEGIIRLYNTESRRSPVLKEWVAHDNAIFDLSWVPAEARLVTASGDKTARLWDVLSGELLGTFKGHMCSLKSVAFAARQTAVFCTGARDGNIILWDTRCTKKEGFFRPVKQISGAHNKTDKQTPSKVKRKRLQPRGLAPMVDSQQSVTVVLFQDEHTLLSSGAVDGTIKMWDLRRGYSVHSRDPVALQSYPYPGTCTRKLGYSGMVLDSSCSNLFATCTDHNIYMFNVTGLRTRPVSVFSGCQNSSFYVKSCVSPDDQFLASGSSDHQAYIWKISEPEHTPMMLQGHSQEVTSVAWCPTDFTKIASCSDDNTVRIWRLDRGADGMRSSIGQANLVGWAGPKPASGTRSPGGPAGSPVHTPGKSGMTRSLAPPSSPQPASCAPSAPDLPLPSSTLSTPPPAVSKPHPTPGGTPPPAVSKPRPTPGGTPPPAVSKPHPTPGGTPPPAVSKPRPTPGGTPPPAMSKPRPTPGGTPPPAVSKPHPSPGGTPPPAVSKPRPSPGGTPPSIRTWLTHTPASPNPLATPPLRKPLSPCPQSPALTPPTTSQRRAKRRLETSEGGAEGGVGEGPCGGAGPCSCVAELYPTPKKRRGLVMCCSAPDSEGRGQEEEEGAAGGVERRPASAKQVDKENSCSGGSDWLSAFSQRLKQGRRTPSTAVRSPSSTKRPEARTPASPVLHSPLSVKKISSYFQRTNPE